MSIFSRRGIQTLLFFVECNIKTLSANTTKWSNTLKQIAGDEFFDCV